MEKIIVHGGKPLTGRVSVSGSKNSVLPIIAASILGVKGTSLIHDVPTLDDVSTIIEVLRNLNIDLNWANGSLQVNANQPLHTEAPYEYVRKMRASVLVMGPLLAREGRAKVALPGGCAIGSRPIDQHLKGFEALGAKITMGHGYIQAEAAQGLQGAHLFLDLPSVGATQNIMMAATLAQGQTTIENAAKEPEIVDLANYLNAMGAQITGEGTGTIQITGVKKLHGVAHTPITDRIEAGTYMIAAAITGGNLFVQGAEPAHLYPLIAKLREMGVEVTEEEEGIQVNAEGRKLSPVDLKTAAHPGFPTDLQPQMMALLCVVDGSAVITETVFENRFMHVEELKRMNAQIKIEGNSAILQGASQLQGTKVFATDLRAGAALILAALAAEGYTEIKGLHHLDRGYENIVGKLVHLGASMERLPDLEESLESSTQQEQYQLKITGQASFA